MTHDEIMKLIEKGVVPGTWADFGAGTGNFTRALRQLIHDKDITYAIDRDERALSQLAANINGSVQTIVADFTQPIDLPALDGILIANALHFVRDQAKALHHIHDYLKPRGRLIVVEYDVKTPRGYIPFPLPYTRFERYADGAGFTDMQHIGSRTSPRTSVTMYAGLAIR